jgi:hypothetical protein
MNATTEQAKRAQAAAAAQEIEDHVASEHLPLPISKENMAEIILKHMGAGAASPTGDMRGEFEKSVGTKYCRRFHLCINSPNSDEDEIVNPHEDRDYELVHIEVKWKWWKVAWQAGAASVPQEWRKMLERCVAVLRGAGEIRMAQEAERLLAQGRDKWLAN